MKSKTGPLRRLTTVLEIMVIGRPGKTEYRP
jgi:hypothetical protein